MSGRTYVLTLGLFGVGVLVLLLAGCTGDGSSDRAASISTPAADAGAPAAPADDVAGEPTIGPSEEPSVDIDGGDEPLFVYTGADVLGADELSLAEVFELGKPVVMNFWAGLCPPCRQEMPDFQAVYDERSEEFVILGVDVGPFTGLGDEGSARDLLDELGVTYPTARVDSETLLREYDIFGMPGTVFFAADGTVVSQKINIISKGEFADRVQEIIDASG